MPPIHDHLIISCKNPLDCTITLLKMANNHNNTRDTYTQCKPRACAFSKCGLVCMEVAVRTELQKGQLDTPYAEQNPIIVHNIIHIQTHNHFLLCNAIATY